MRLRAIGLILTLVLGSLVAPLATQVQPPLPVIGYLSQRSPTDSASIVAAFRQGLQEEGFVEGQNVAIDYRFAEGQIDRVPVLARELVRREVTVFVAPAAPARSSRPSRWYPRPCPSSSRWAVTRSSWVSLPAWPDRATTSRG